MMKWYELPLDNHLDGICFLMGQKLVKQVLPCHYCTIVARGKVHRIDDLVAASCDRQTV
jgi:hypothetical protein